ncbi:MAG: selenocysteine-specific translation elongation factor [Anaerolineae bacterium]
MFVVGTAGHVDHGKSSLVRALTGINPDRLREEQLREMTIDLGFAWVTLPSGQDISIVDVPGHEDFVKNMLSGVGGIDLALLVVAADEAVMPQTREHLAILDLLRIPRGIVALTKSDLIDDPDWLDLVVEEVREAIAHSTLAAAPIIPVSSVSGQGLDTLLATIDESLADAPPRPDLGVPRLPIDRVFSIAGFGTVVTGTLTGGHLDVGDSVEIVPGGKVARIRGLQSHKTKVERALPGMRVAANLVGVDVEDLSRGQVVARPGTIGETALVDVRLEVVRDAAWPVRQGMVVDFFTGAASVIGRVRLLDAEELGAGATGWAQVQLYYPVACSRNDRFIVRLPSPSVTLGGGAVVEAHPARRHRRFDEQVLRRLEALYEGDPASTLLALLDERGPLAASHLVTLSQLELGAGERALSDLLARGEAMALADLSTEQSLAQWPGLVVSRKTWDRTLESAVALLGPFHRAQPLRAGMSREEFRSRLRLTGDWANRFLDRANAEGALVVSGDLVALPGQGAALSGEDLRAIGKVMDLFRAAPYTPPGWGEVESALGSALAGYLVESGRLVRLNDAVVFERSTLDEMVERLRTSVGAGKPFTVAQARDLFGTSRKYIVAFLEEMDRRRITRRLGDERVLR